MLGYGFEYDALGNIIKITYPMGKYKEFKYLSGNKVEYKNEVGKLYAYTYRSFGSSDHKELMHVKPPISSASVSIDRDVIGNITSLEQNGVVKSRIYYPGTDRVEYKYGWDEPYTYYSYYLNGNLKKESNGLYWKEYYYNKINKVSKVKYSTPYTPTEKYNYDLNLNLSSVLIGGINNYYKYDGNDNLIKEGVSVDNIKLAVDYEYDGNDYLNRIKYPDAVDQYVDLHPDAFGRPTKMHPLASINGYHSNGLIEDIYYANGIFTINSLDNRLRPNRSLIFKEETGKVLSNRSYNYDATNSLTEIKEYAIDGVFDRKFSYDALDRLLTAKGPWGDGVINYDSKGNISSQKIGNSILKYDYAYLNRLSSISGYKSYNFKYDGWGNVISNGRHNFRYDNAKNLRCINKIENSRGRLCKESLGIAYSYGVNNQKVVKNNQGEKTYYLYSRSGNLLVEYRPKQAELKQYAYAGGKLIAKRTVWDSQLDLDRDGQLDATETNQRPSSYIKTAEKLVFYHTDLNGSVIASSSHHHPRNGKPAYGNIVWSETYTPYGERQQDSIYAKENQIWFAGKQVDDESGLLYFGARHYDPVIGRFMGVDPVAPDPSNIHSLNRYAYANNNPNKYIDPDGRVAETIWDIGNVVFDIGKITAGYATGNDQWVDDGTVDLAVDSAAMLIPVVPAGVTKLRHVDEVATKGGSKLPIYDARTLKRMGEDAFHNFPASFEKSILSQKPIVRSNGRSEFLQQGTINGKEGVFHITTDKGGEVMRHRAFIPQNDWARYSKRWELPGIDGIAK